MDCLFLILGYAVFYIVTRMIMFFFVGLFSSKPLMDKENKDDMAPMIMMPVGGEIVFVIGLGFVIFVLPVLAAGGAGEWLKKKLEERGKIQERRQAYLDNLAKFGLTPKDIPDYIKDPESLDQYLTILKKHEILDAKNKF